MPVIIKNTFPSDPRAAHAEPGDICRWELSKNCYRLVRESDGKALFSTGQVDRNGNLYSTRQPPKLIGVIAEVKSKGYVFEVAQY